MGILWRAEDLISERYVAIKELRFPDPLDHMQRRALAARVRREARAMASVEHPGLAHVVDVVDDGDRPWVVTELIDAPTLAQLVSRRGPLTPERAADIGLRLLDVLEAAHEQGMVHRFLQPTKVFVTGAGGSEDQGEGEVRVADFGIASLIGDPAVASNGNVGGVLFMAPEQAGTPDADLWSLGAVLYFAVEGVAPFSGATPAAILTSMATDRPRPALRAGALAPVLEAALVADPSGRAGAGDLRALLEEAAGPPAWTRLSPEPPVSPEEVHREPTQGDAIVWPDLIQDPFSGVDAPPPPEEEEAVEPPAADEPPPVALAPREALARMFSPDPGRPTPPVESAHEDPEPPPPWPVVPKRSLWTVALCTLVVAVMVLILVTNGRRFFSPDTQAAQAIASVKWVRYTDPATGFGIDYPRDWIVTRDGIYTDFRHPASAAALRVVAQPSTARSAEQGWLDLEKRFQQEQPGYRRIRLEPKPFLGLDAAEWEFTYTKADASGRNIDLHNVDLGVVTGQSAFALNFETRATNWSAVEPFFQRFKSSFRPPGR